MSILTKPVIGWRVYDISTPGLLTSLNNVVVPRERAESFCKGRWNKGVFAGRCVSMPEADCSCGFYSFKTVKQLFDSSYLQHGVVAQVWLWGTVHEHTIGWRAQFSYPKALWAYGPMAESCQLRLAKEYLVPVKLFSYEWPEEYKAREFSQMGAWISQPPLLLEEELLKKIKAGDKAALKKMKARLASAISTRKKTLLRLEGQYNDCKASLEAKQKQYDKIRRIKL